MVHLPSDAPVESSLEAEPQPIVVALLGNPNTGKSTIFNALAGIHQKTGNYPGVTIEKRVGNFRHEDKSFLIVDLPGTYSLAPHTQDEMLAVKVLLGRQPGLDVPDVIVCVLDASNLERNLFLTSQILELHKPTVVALNMTDVAEKHGVVIDVEQLSGVLGVPVVSIQGNRRLGLDELKRRIADAPNEKPVRVHEPFRDEIKQRIERLEESSAGEENVGRFVLTRMLFDADGFMIDQMGDQIGTSFRAALEAERLQLKAEGGFAECESLARYGWIKSQLAEVVSEAIPSKPTFADRVDRWLTHPLIGLILAALVMMLLFQLVFWAAGPASSGIDWLTGWAAAVVDSLFIRFTGSADGALHSLLVNGLIAGVGGVLVFLPQIMLLFLILAILEDSGYLARLAFLTDKYLSRVGLSGITLIPLLSSFACAIPGIMATRVIKNERERLITILIAPLMSCSARLPVYILLIAAFVPSTSFFGFGLQGLTMFVMYLVGIVVAIAVAWILKKTILRSGTSSFVMELPTYKIPMIRNVALKVYEGGAAFVRDAGTIIVAATIVVWAAAYFPRSEHDLPSGLLDRKTELTRQLDSISDNTPEFEIAHTELSLVSNQIDASYLKNSYLGKAGRWIEPAVAPLGWDWRIGSAAIASFPAREVLVSTMGVLFGLGEDVNEESTSLRNSLIYATRDDSSEKLFSLPVALSIMVFFALCAQCSSTLAVIKRETGTWYWPAFTFVYMTTLAYVGAFLTFQISKQWIG